jgi:hypothetical protein
MLSLVHPMVIDDGLLRQFEKVIIIEGKIKSIKIIISLAVPVTLANSVNLDYASL